MTNEQVKPIVRKLMNDIMDSTLQILHKRIRSFGITNYYISPVESERLIVELPIVKNQEHIIKTIQSSVQMEFWETYTSAEMTPFIVAANSFLKEKQDTTVIQKEINPILDLIVDQGYQGGPVILTIATKDTAYINTYFKNPKIRKLLPVTQHYTKFMWGKLASELAGLYAVKGNKDNIPELNSDVITKATQQYNRNKQVVIAIEMNPKGAKIWEEITGRVSQQRNQIAIVANDIVISAPGVPVSITGGKSEISGSFSIEEAQSLATILNTGQLPISLTLIKTEKIASFSDK